MATARTLIEELAQEIGWTVTTVEAYALELRRIGWWPETKRGRGASSITAMQAAKLLIAILSDGPKSLSASGGGTFLTKYDGRGFFLRTANMAYFPADAENPVYIALCDELGIKHDAGYLDFVEGFLKLFIQGDTEKVIQQSVGNEYLDDEWDYKGPQVRFVVRGPYPVAEIRFHFSTGFKEKLIKIGVDPDRLVGLQEFTFLHQFFKWQSDIVSSGQPAGYWDEILDGIREYSAKGIITEKSFGGRELSACARVLRGDELVKDKDKVSPKELSSAATKLIETHKPEMGDD